MHSTTQCLTFLSPHWANPTATQAHTFEHKTSRSVNSNSAPPPNLRLLRGVLERRLFFRNPPLTLYSNRRRILHLVMMSLGTVCSKGAGLVHLVYLTITYQLVKLFGASLKKASRNRVESRYCWNRDVVESCILVGRMGLRPDHLRPSSGK